MKLTLLNLRFLFIKSIIFSLLLHWAIFNNFLFILPTQAESHKPKFIFLGSILQSSDMKKTLTKTHTNVSSLNNLTKVQKASQLYSSSPDKPTLRKHYTPKNKRTLKTVYKDPPNDRPKQPIALKEFNINRHIEPYRPLRLKDHD